MTKQQLIAMNQLSAWLNKPSTIIIVPLIGSDKSSVIKGNAK